MKKIIQYFIYILTITLPSISQAQISQNAEADEIFQKGLDAYQVEDYKSAAHWFKQVKEYLGKPDVELQPYLAISLYESKDYGRARRETEAYFEIAETTATSEYNQMQDLLTNIDEALENDTNEFENAASKMDVALLTGYLEDFPYGIYRREANKIIEEYYFENGRSDAEQMREYLEKFPNGIYRLEAVELIEDLAYEDAKEKDRIEAYQQYLEDFPKGKYSQEVQDILWEREKIAYNNAIEQNHEEAYLLYLEKFPQGEFQDTIRSLMIRKMEVEGYEKAEKSGSIQFYKDYLKKHPDGEFAEAAHEFLKAAYIQTADLAYKNELYDKATKNYSSYIEEYPTGERVAYAMSRLQQADKKAKKQRKYQSIRDRLYFGYHFDEEAELGFSIGTLNQRKLGGYLSGRSTLESFQITHIYEFDDEGNNNFDRVYDDTQLNGNMTYRRFTAALGFTKKIIRPLWIYFGGGVQYQQNFYEVQEMEGGRIFETKWAIQKDELNIDPIFDGGAIVDLYGLNLRIGISALNTEDWSATFGVGFSFKK